VNKRSIVALTTFLAFAGFVGWAAAESPAFSLTLTLEQLSLDNVDDLPGRWQHEGGRVFCPHGTQVANYAAYRRATVSGTSAQNTAMLTLTLFFLGENPPENITLQGSHDFSSGNYIGSVSAASQAFRIVRDASFSGATNVGSLTIDLLGLPGINPCQ
jgi:hypothetical protein